MLRDVRLLVGGSISCPVGVMGILLLGVLAGCETTPNVTREKVIADYNSGRYSASRQGAEALASQSTGRAKNEANYLAGLSAVRMKDDMGALSKLVSLSDDSDKMIAGHSSAQVGLIYASRSQHDRALPYFKKAVDKLDGNEQAQAYYHLALTEQKLGRWDSARSSLSIAATKATDPALKAEAKSRMSKGGFTLQFGAFSSQTNADKHIAEIAPRLARAGLSPKVTPAKDNTGRTLHLVQAGQYLTFGLAQQARQKLGMTEVVIAQVEN